MANPVPAQRANLIGKKFGDLTVIADAPDRFRNRYVKVRCTCGSTSIVAYSALYRGKTRCAKCVERDRKERRTCPYCAGPKSPSARSCAACTNEVFPPPPQYPEALSTIAKRYGVSRQRVSQVVLAIGWKAAMYYFNLPADERRIENVPKRMVRSLETA